MTVLVTGAGGFLGREIVGALLRRGHEVRAMVRPATDPPRALLGDRITLVRADLRSKADLAFALVGVDTVIHAAAGTSGTLEEQLAASVVATERLLEAMTKYNATHLVLVSTFSVYDWRRAERVVNETTQLESDLYARDGYAIAKTWQERIIREHCEKHGWRLTVVRPGFIWGKGREWVSGAGLLADRVVLVNGPLRRLPLTHVTNCADCIAAIAENPRAIGQTFNIVDGDAVRAWRFARDYVRRSGKRRFCVPVPYFAGLALAYVATMTARVFFGKIYKLPGILLPIRHRARFGSRRFSNAHLARVIGWRPPLAYRECLAKTYCEKASDTSNTGVSLTAD